MRREVEQGRRDSARRFRSLMLPAFAELGIDGEWEPLEEELTCGLCDRPVRNPVAAALDASTGIDALWRRGTTVYGVGLRIQPVFESFDTFTIRGAKANGASTEIERYRVAIKRGSMHPELLLHAYIDLFEKRVLAFGMAWLRNIVAMIDAHKCREVPNTQDGTIFHAVEWADVAAEGYWLRAHRQLYPGLWVPAVEQVA